MSIQNPTVNYGWTLPTVGGSADAWGTILNTLLGDDATGIDAIIKLVDTNAKNASNLSSGTVPSARLSGSYTGITAVGTLTAGSIPATLLTGTIASARLSGSYTGITAVAQGAVTAHQAALSIAATQLTGTIASARISGSYTGITAVGTLASLAVTGAATLADDLTLTKAGGNIVVGSNENVGVLRNGVLNGGVVVAGGDASNSGGNIIFRGPSHADASHMVFRQGSTERMRIGASGAVTVGGTLEVTGAVTLGSTLAVTGAISAGSYSGITWSQIGGGSVTPSAGAVTEYLIVTVNGNARRIPLHATI